MDAEGADGGSEVEWKRPLTRSASDGDLSARVTTDTDQGVNFTLQEFLAWAKDQSTAGTFKLTGAADARNVTERKSPAPDGPAHHTRVDKEVPGNKDTSVTNRTNDAEEEDFRSRGKILDVRDKHDATKASDGDVTIARPAAEEPVPCAEEKGSEIATSPKEKAVPESVEEGPANKLPSDASDQELGPVTRPGQVTRNSVTPERKEDKKGDEDKLSATPTLTPSSALKTVSPSTGPVSSPTPLSSSSTPMTSPAVPSLAEPEAAAEPAAGAGDSVAKVHSMENTGDVLRARPAPNFSAGKVKSPRYMRILGKEEISEEESRLVADQRASALLKQQASSMPAPLLALPPDVRIPQHCGRGCRCFSTPVDLRDPWQSARPEKSLKQERSETQEDMSAARRRAKLQSVHLLGPDHEEPPLSSAKGAAIAKRFKTSSFFPQSNLHPGPPPASRILPYPPGPAGFHAQMQSVADVAGHALRTAVARAVQTAAQNFAVSTAAGHQPSGPAAAQDDSGQRWDPSLRSTGERDWSTAGTMGILSPGQTSGTSAYMQTNWHERDPSGFPKPSWDTSSQWQL